MSDIMQCIPFDSLMDWILEEYQTQGTIFGEKKFAHFTKEDARPIFEEKIESVFGPAAGPNSQLAQNIIASYVCGSRFFELKTVQKMDGAELAACVNKPCIVAEDEAYNCEWSTELEIPQAFGEYVKAWVACHVLAKELGLGEPDGFVFNMSVGYDLEGIKTEKVNNYIEGMKQAADSEVFQECIAWLNNNLDRFQKIDADFVASIPSVVSQSITLSTLHGCPPQEIERIATYLIEEKGLNTYIKCNPTLLGYDYARKTLDSLGFDYIAFDTTHFDEDLQWEDAVPMIERLIARAEKQNVEFGVKLTNTFPVDVTRNELPSEEMYMSGRSLYPLSLSLAKKISEQFDGKLRMSYSGGADYSNIADLVSAGIWPVTMATTILKPGGYERLVQIAAELKCLEPTAFTGADPVRIAELVDECLEGDYFRKPIKGYPERHIDAKLPLLDCFTAPCRHSCPIHQDIPAYLSACQKGHYAEALDTVLERNALPFITGTICPHFCGDSCMRNYYEEFVHIREFKLEAAKKGFDGVLPMLHMRGNRPGTKVAIIGGGPAGLSAASFLSRAGVKVTVFERKAQLGGIVRYAIPEFRIASDDIDKDIRLCKAYDAEFRCNFEVQDPRQLLEKGYTDVIIACGAWAPNKDLMEGVEVLDAVEFLVKAKNAPQQVELGEDVVVIGAGNTAMDTARVAKRMPGVKNVRLVYRRNAKAMPAQEEELQFALEDGVEFLELLSPVSYENNLLTCDVMELGEADASGRPRPVATGEQIQVPATSIIAALGEKVEQTLFESAELEMARGGRPVVNAMMKTSNDHIYAIGDARRGPATVVEGIADAMMATTAICGYDFNKADAKNIADGYNQVVDSHGSCSTDVDDLKNTRCLGCPTVCETCVEVCPNRANVAVRVPGMAQRQVIHVDGMCNECGNCAVFCPYSGGRPFKDKLTLFWAREDMNDSTNDGFAMVDDGFFVRYEGTEGIYNVDDETCGLPDAVRKTIVAIRDDYKYLFIH